MCPDVKSFNVVVKVSTVCDILENTDLNGFPVVNDSNRVEGHITRSILIAMIKGKCWYNVVKVIHADEDFSGKPSISRKHLSIN